MPVIGISTKVCWYQRSVSNWYPGSDGGHEREVHENKQKRKKKKHKK